MKGILIIIAIIDYLLLVLGNQYFGLTTFILLNLAFAAVVVGLILKNETFRFLSILFFSFTALMDGFILLNKQDFVLIEISLFFALCGEIIAISINGQTKVKKDIKIEKESKFHNKNKSLEKELNDEKINEIIFIKDEDTKKDAVKSVPKKQNAKKNSLKKKENIKVKRNATTKKAKKKVAKKNTTTKKAKKSVKAVSKNKKNTSKTSRKIVKKESPKYKYKSISSISKVRVKSYARRKSSGKPMRKIFGSVNSNLFHYSGCKVGARIKDKNKIFFKSDKDAWAKHYRKHKCKLV